jgi:hypothetical protein
MPMLPRKIKRRFVTLIEMMIVMFLIALITGVVAYNYRGTLEEGKVFKTQTGIQKLETVLNLEIAKNPQLAGSLKSNWQAIILNSPLVHDPKALILDGWGQPYDVDIDDNGVVRVTSQKYNDYLRAHQQIDMSR